MKKLPLLFILILVIGAIGCSDSDDTSSPEDVVRGFLEATQDKDVEAMASYCTEDFGEMISVPENFKEGVEEISFSNISIEVVEQSENEAEINLSYDALVDVKGEEFSDNNNTGTIFLIRVDNSWLINYASDERADEMAEEISPERFTEFYMLGPEGKAANYPRDLSVGEEASVIVGVVNREKAETTYEVEITIDGGPVNRIGPVTLGHEEKWEQGVSFSPVNSGTGQIVEFLLFKDGEESPSSDVHLWIDVSE